MRVLREAYTEEDIRQRVTDTRNIFEALIDSCYILASCFEDTEGDKETNDKLSRYASGYARDVKDLAADFEDDYEDFIKERDTELDDESEEEPTEEETAEEEEVVEESLKEAPIKESRTIYEMRDDIDDLTDELDAVEGDRSECYITWNFGEDNDGNLTGGVDIHPHPRYEDDPEKIEELKAKVETIFRNHGFELDNAFKVNPGKTLFGAIHYQIKKSKDDFDGFFSNSDVTDKNESLNKNLKEASLGSVEDFFKKMEGKSKAEAEKIVRQAKGNPNADKAYQKYLKSPKEVTEDLVDYDSFWDIAKADHKEAYSLYEDYINFLKRFDPFYIGFESTEEQEESWNTFLNDFEEGYVESYIEPLNWLEQHLTNESTRKRASELKKRFEKVYRTNFVGEGTEITEDTEKVKTGKWVNKGKEGTHGTFKTKKAADAQRKAMFANGFKEGLNESWMDNLDSDVYRRLCACKSRKSDVEPLVNVKWAAMKKAGKDKEGFTKEDALVSVLELLDENGCDIDLTQDEYNEILA